jgi:hypothetical protein
MHTASTGTRETNAMTLPRQNTAANRLLTRLRERQTMEVRDVVRMFTDATYSTDRAAYKRGYVKAWRVVNRLLALELIEYEWINRDQFTRGRVKLKTNEVTA